MYTFVSGLSLNLLLRFYNVFVYQKCVLFIAIQNSIICKKTKTKKHNIFLHSPEDGNLGCLQFGEKAVMNILVCVITLNSFGYTPKSGNS